MIKALIFDCDGVLVDTERDGHRVGFNRAFEQMGIDAEWDVELYGKLLLVEVGAHPLLAAGDEQELAVKRHVPFGVDAHLRERAVEADPVAVALGIDQHAVAVEDDRLEHASRALPQAALAR